MYRWHMARCRRVFLLLSFLFALNSAIAAPPDCSVATADPDSLWPPNHKFVDIAIVGVTDPDGDAVSIAVNCVMQDEPLNTTGDGNTQYDGSGIGDSFAQVRAERRGNSNGRFYHIGFTATDINGESCVDTVLVSVAHNPSNPPVDEGPLYHSTPQAGICGGQPQNTNPEITSTPVTAVQVDTRYTYDVEAFDADGDTLVYSLIEGPAGMGIDSMLGVLTWLPGAGDLGSVDVTVLVDDGNGGTAQQSFSINVTAAPNGDPVITSEPDLVVEANTAYQYDVEAMDPDGDTLTYSLAVAPAGMTIDSQSGLIDWLPGNSDIGDVTVVVRVDDGNGGSDEQAFTVNVVAQPNNPPEITSTAVTSVTANTQYLYDVEAIDIDGDMLSYSLPSSPGGMSIDPQTGLISWLPDASDVGNVDVTVLVEDGNGGSAQQSYTLAVLQVVNTNPVITSNPVTTVEADQNYVYDVEAVDEDGDVLVFILLVSPDGMTINSETGVISWLPTQDDIGDVIVEVMVDDGNGGSDEQAFVITVTPPER